MTLSNFIQVYIYTPIVRSYQKFTFNKALLASIIAMFISGLWHGADWNYVLFGIIHGFALCWNRIQKKRKWRKLPKKLAWFFNFHFVVLTLIMFRAGDMITLRDYVNGIIGRNGIILPEFMQGMTLPFSAQFGELLPRLGGDILTPICLLGCLLIVVCCKTTQEIVKEFKPTRRNAFIYGGLLALCLLSLDNPTEFIYFQF